jgi:Fe-S oxidoreductase
MAKLKYEFLSHYQSVHGVPLRNRLFAHIGTLNRLGSVFPALTNRGLRSPVIRAVLDRWLGIDRRRTLPTIALTTFQEWFKRRKKPPAGKQGTVILWDDTYLSYNEPEIGQAAVAILEAAGFEVRVIAERRCCGRPMISKGLLKEARENAQHNVSLLAPMAAAGIPIIGVEPSCVAAFRDEYPDLLRTDEARLVARQTFFMEEFLATLAGKGELNLSFEVGEQHILIHGHCYQKALTGTAALHTVLNQLPDSTVEEIPSGCCGMAGSFGYEREHYAISMACGEDRLFPAVRATNTTTMIVASGVSCRHQIGDGTQRTVIHPVVALSQRLKR